MMNIRKIALGLLEEYEAADKYINLSLASHSLDGLSSEQRAVITALLYTTVERKITYDYYISSISARNPDSIDSHTRNILRLGLCQICDMKSVPDFAAVNETVKLARHTGERAFVNGVLRTAVRMKDSLPMPKEEKNYRRYLSVKYSFPLWIVKLLDIRYGREATEEMLGFFNNEKYTDLTVNTLKISREGYAKKLEECGFEAEADPNTGNSIRITRSVNPELLFGFSDGLVFVQDRACQISAAALAPKAGDVIVDVCASPGGKSFSAAILMGDEGEIHSFDLHQSKLSLIINGASRLSIKSIRVAERDAERPDELLFNKADKVICDVPCSGLGVLGKKPDLRYKHEERIKDLPPLQYSILEHSVKYLKAGGELIYSTCTLNPAENEDVVTSFLRANPDYELVPFTVGGIKSNDGMLTLLPHIHKTDGFFIAKIKRTG